jgi:hypothetical protein
MAVWLRRSVKGIVELETGLEQGCNTFELLKDSGKCMHFRRTM